MMGSDFDVGIRETPSPTWQPIETAPESVVVETKIDDTAGVRNVQNLYRDGRLWWTPDGGMYVYYRPTHWRFVGTLADAHSKDPSRPAMPKEEDGRG